MREEMLVLVTAVGLARVHASTLHVERIVKQQWEVMRRTVSICENMRCKAEAAQLKRRTTDLPDVCIA